MTAKVRYFRTGVLQDAWIRHEGVVKGPGMTPAEAVNAAYDQWKGRRDDIVLVEASTSGFDACEPISVEEIEEITREEYETQRAEDTAPNPTAPALDIIKDFAHEQGWATETIVVVLAQFIEAQGDLKGSLLRYLGERAKAE